MWGTSRRLRRVLGLASIGLAAGTFASAFEELDAGTVGQIRTATDVALRAVRFHQSKDGSYGDGLTTALVVRAFMDSPRRYTEEDGPFVAKALGTLSLEGGDARKASTWATLAVAARRSPSTASAEALAWHERLRSALAASPEKPPAETLAFAAEALAGAGVSLDADFWNEGAPDGAAAEYVRTLAARTGSNESTASPCSETTSHRERYFVAATLAALARDPKTGGEVPVECARELASAILRSQGADGLWTPMDDGDGSPLRATALALLSLQKLGEI